jgi:hypothetical protein
MLTFVELDRVLTIIADTFEMAKGLAVMAKMPCGSAMRLNHESRYSWTDPQIFGSPHVGNPASQQSLLFASLYSRLCVNAGGELVENYILTPSWRKKYGEVWHRVIFAAGHLTL